MDFLMLNHPCIPGLKPTWSQWKIVLMCSRFGLGNYYWVFFIDIHKGNPVLVSLSLPAADIFLYLRIDVLLVA